MKTPPCMSPYGRHILICNGRFCDPEGKANALYQRLGFVLGDLARYDNPQRVKRGVTPCLGVCSGGPIAVIYPEGVWYHHVDEALLDRIVVEHLGRDRPVEDAIFSRLTPESEVSCTLETE